MFLQTTQTSAAASDSAHDCACQPFRVASHRSFSDIIVVLFSTIFLNDMVTTALQTDRKYARSVNVLAVFLYCTSPYVNTLPQNMYSAITTTVFNSAIICTCTYIFLLVWQVSSSPTYNGYKMVTIHIIFLSGHCQDLNSFFQFQ